MLSEILTATGRRVDMLVSRLDDVVVMAEAAAPTPSLADALAGPGMSVIAEIKRRSPSRGDLAPGLDPVATARNFVEGGADAISVLTEPEFFSGSITDLEAVVASVHAPVLRKDFIMHRSQVVESRAIGASALLLIVAALDDDTLSDLIAESDAWGLDALVEVHDATEAKRAIEAGATMIGVNNRNLTDFTVDLATAEGVATVVDGVAVTVAESGIFTAGDSSRMAAAGYDAVLVGEALMRTDDPPGLIADLKGAVS